MGYKEEIMLEIIDVNIEYNSSVEEIVALLSERHIIEKIINLKAKRNLDAEEYLNKKRKIVKEELANIKL